MDDFVIARNPDPASGLPYLLRLPLPRPVVLKARETWPRTAKVYCHRADEWPEDAEIVERVPVTSCVARGPAVDLVLDRGRENRSQLVFTRLRGGREAIFWQSPRTNRKARPGVRTPTARASGLDALEIVVDSHERYPYRFASQQASTVRGGPAARTDGSAVSFGPAGEAGRTPDLHCDLPATTTRLRAAFPRLRNARRCVRWCHESHQRRDRRRDP